MDAFDCIEIKRGRPAKTESVVHVEWKTMKLPLPIWLAMEEIAYGQGLTVHEAIRIASIEWIKRQSEPPAKDAPGA